VTHVGVMKVFDIADPVRSRCHLYVLSVVSG
jgi:hypothetical protein